MGQFGFKERVRRACAAANGRWHEIFVSIGIDAQLVDGKARACPLCGGKDRFVFDDKHGRGNYFCRQCGPGDGFALVSKYSGYNFVDTLEVIERFCGIEVVKGKATNPIPKEVREDIDQKASIEKRQRLEMTELWAQAEPIRKDDPVYKYLRGRGLDPKMAGYEIRYHKKLAYRSDDGQEVFFPAMLSRVVDRTGCIVNLHRTYLTEDGKKAPVDKVKKLMPGGVRGACVQLGGKVTDTLNLAEGIETAMAVAKITGKPTWATLGCVNMKNIEKVPAGVETVNIFADNDACFVGQAAAYDLAHRLSAKGLRVSVHVTQGVDTDWLDEALDRGLL